VAKVKRGRRAARELAAPRYRAGGRQPLAPPPTLPAVERDCASPRSARSARRSRGHPVHRHQGGVLSSATSDLLAPLAEQRLGGGVISVTTSIASCRAGSSAPAAPARRAAHIETLWRAPACRVCVKLAPGVSVRQRARGSSRIPRGGGTTPSRRCLLHGLRLPWEVGAACSGNGLQVQLPLRAISGVNQGGAPISGSLTNGIIRRHVHAHRARRRAPASRSVRRRRAGPRRALEPARQLAIERGDADETPPQAAPPPAAPADRGPRLDQTRLVTMAPDGRDSASTSSTCAGDAQVALDRL